MSRCEFVFVKRVPDASITLFSSLSQDPARAEKQRRHDVANDRQARDPEQQLLLWRITADRSHQYQTLNSLGIVECNRGGDGATVRSAHDRCFFDPESIHQTKYRVRLGVDGVSAVRRFVGVAISGQVGSDYAKPRIGQRQKHIAPYKI